MLKKGLVWKGKMSPNALLHVDLGRLPSPRLHGLLVAVQHSTLLKVSLRMRGHSPFCFVSTTIRALFRE